MSLDEMICQKLRSSQFSFKEDNKYFKNGICPSCGDQSLYIRKDALFKIVCNHKSKCGFESRISDQFPELFLKIQNAFPATKADPRLTARAYMSIHRGFQDLSLFEDFFTQGIWRNEFATVRFYLARNIYWEKIIECEERSSNFGGSYQGLAWSIHSKTELEGAVYLTEAIFDAMSLESVNKTAVSVMSANHIPESYLDDLMGKGIRWHVAYDNDNAGMKGAKKMSRWLRSNGEEVCVVLPEEGKDWNDHLKEGKLARVGFFEECRFRGRLFEAADAKAYADILLEKNRMPLCFEYENCYWGVSQEKNEAIVSRQSNFTLKLLYTLKDEMTEEVQYIFKVFFQNDNKPREVRLDSSQLSTLQAFRGGILAKAPGAVWVGQAQTFYFKLLDQYFKNPPTEVRFLQQIGYDEKTGAYLFTDHAYSAEGKLVLPNEHNFFSFSKTAGEGVKIVAKNNQNQFKIGNEFDWAQTNLLIDAWGWEGFCVFSWFFMSMFSEQIGKALGWFPFLSVYGPPYTGKSTLIKWIWRALGREDYEGLQATKKFSDKFVARQLALFSSLPTIIKEINKAITCLNLEDLLPAFDRDPIIGRAERSHGLETYYYAFRSALGFVQNDEPFESPQLISRIISLRFSDDRFNIKNKKSLSASKKIQNAAIEELCGFRHLILSNSKTNVSTILQRYKEIEKEFLDNCRTSRVAQNYALLWAACVTLGQSVPRWEEIKVPCYDYLMASIETKERKLEVRKDLRISRFFEVLDELVSAGRLANHSPNKTQHEEIRFSWSEFQALALDDRQHDLFRDVPQLQGELQKESRFIKYASMHSKIVNKNTQLWAFKLA